MTDDRDLSAIQAEIAELAAEFRARSQVSKEDLIAAFERMRSKRIEKESRSATAGKLRLVRTFLVGIWGQPATENAIALAAERVHAVTPDDLCFELWPKFLKQLQAVVGGVCGSAVASLVWESGQ
jgi:hypothetical protein